MRKIVGSWGQLASNAGYGLTIGFPLWHKSIYIRYNCAMKRNEYIHTLNELSASEGIFTTAQAARLGVPRNVLAKACAAGRLVRIVHGAYRMAGVPPSETDELVALWKMTDPSKFTHERARVDGWDGVAVGGPLRRICWG